MSVKDLELNNQLNIENTDVAKLNNNEKLNEKREFHPVENYNPTENKSISGKAFKIFGISLCAFIVLLLIAYFVFTFLNANNENIVSGVFIKGVDVSGLSVEEATDKMKLKSI